MPPRPLPGPRHHVSGSGGMPNAAGTQGIRFGGGSLWLLRCCNCVTQFNFFGWGGLMLCRWLSPHLSSHWDQSQMQDHPHSSLYCIQRPPQNQNFPEINKIIKFGTHFITVVSFFGGLHHRTSYSHKCVGSWSALGNVSS